MSNSKFIGNNPDYFYIQGADEDPDNEKFIEIMRKYGAKRFSELNVSEALIPEMVKNFQLYNGMDLQRLHNQVEQDSDDNSDDDSDNSDDDSDDDYIPDLESVNSA